jgi:hypothetical protein
MVARARGPQAALVALAFTLAAGAGTTGCRTSKEDVDRWANTTQGPRKLVAVVIHDKYPLELRVEAAMSLIRMKPRGGRRVGIQGIDDQPGLIDTLASMPPAERSKIVNRLVPQLEAEMVKPPPKVQAGQPAPPDPSFPYKDAAFALLTHDGGSLVPEEENRKRLRAALAAWAMADFPTRMDESSQMYGMEQVLRELKAEGVQKLPDLIDPHAKKIDRMADLIAELGDADAKLRASKKLVDVATYIASKQWVDEKSPAVDAANKASKLNPTPEQFKMQLDQYQEEELLRTFSSMKRVGQKPVVDFLLAFVQDKNQPPKRRAAALAALEGNLPKDDPAVVETLIKIAAGKEEDDSVRDVALRRIGDMPRSKVVVDKLYSLFTHDMWQVRWIAAELILKMSDTSEIDEFMRNLGRAQGLSISEPLIYGARLAEMKGPKKPQDIADRYAGQGNSVPARLTALSYYYRVGTKEQLSKVEGYANDKSKVPECSESAKECEWKCEYKKETKDVKTVGDFVEYCVKPAMEGRSEADKKAAEKKGDKK